MKVVILETYRKTKEHSFDGQLRGALILQKELGWEVVFAFDQGHYKRLFQEKIDVIILSRGMFWTDRENMTRLLDLNPQAKVYFMIWDYVMKTNSFIREINKKRNLILLTNGYDDGEKTLKIKKEFSKTIVYDFNLLLAKKPNPLEQKIYDVIYWGGFREKRKKYFEKYFKENIFVSSIDKDKFKDVCPKCDLVSWLSQSFYNWDNSDILNRFYATIYINDDVPYTQPMSNRVYEALQHNVLVFFDANCKSVMGKAGLKNDFFIVDSYKELIDKVKETKKDLNHLACLNIQQSWYLKKLIEQKELLQSLKRDIENEKDANIVNTANIAG